MSIKFLWLAGLVLVAGIRITTTPHDLSLNCYSEIVDIICASFGQQSAHEMAQLIKDPEQVFKQHYEAIQETPSRIEMLKLLIGKPGLESLFRVEKQVFNPIITQWILVDGHVSEPFSSNRVGPHLRSLFRNPTLRERIVEHILAQEAGTMESYEWLEAYLEIAEPDQITSVFEQLQHVMSPVLLLKFFNEFSTGWSLLQSYLEEGGLVRYMNATLVWKMFRGTAEEMWALEALIEDHSPNGEMVSTLHALCQMLQRSRKDVSYVTVRDAIEELNGLRGSLPDTTAIDGSILVLLAEISDCILPEDKGKLFQRAFEITQPARMPTFLVRRCIDVLRRQGYNVSELLEGLPRDKWPIELLSLEERRLLWLQHVPMGLPPADLVASMSYYTLIDSLWDGLIPTGPFSDLAVSQLDTQRFPHGLTARGFRDMLIALPYLVATRQRTTKLGGLFLVNSWDRLLSHARTEMSHEPRSYELDLWQQIINVSFLKYFFTPKEICTLVSGNDT
ncbi:hypothetical protein PSACC_03568 [Paramicrosporidium saccamoebae]|uniref:Uncharacterized protein n=1 Tax=Paramicrosporidium saccamoebae TaxID=1246581 RepID=A0A2H9TFQ2_9FUNG|nr:hypothetical protein PSACC_03568 [Paramicrosporidium saccamoebae]